MQQMICNIHYGGKITQELDRDLFLTYGELWISENIFGNNFQFNQSNLDTNYVIPDFTEHTNYVNYIKDLPESDNPLVFGLNPNAAITRALTQSRKLITTLIDVQPTDTAAAGGKSPEQMVKEMIENEFMKMVPDEFDMNYANNQLEKMKHKRLEGSGKTIPLVMFLFQEIQRFQNIIKIVKGWFNNCVLAIDGQIIMSPELADCIKVINNLQVPRPFMYDPSGAEISWLNPSLGGWLGSMVDRHYQLNLWLTCKDGYTSRPPSFWLTGFFNPTGFLTAVRQEICRANVKNNWALD
jgi:dynein heavy chain